MTEHALRFGQWRSLVGVVCEPEGERADDTPAILFLNSGLISHAGPHRLHVNLARHLARHGFLSLRFDLSGIGDSGPRQDRMPRQESLVAETREAMDHLADTYGVQRFVLYGICTGADQAVRTALQDERVVGIMLIDGYTYRTRGFRRRHYGSRILRGSSWANLFTGRHPMYGWIRSWFSRHADEDHGHPAVPRPGLYVRPPRAEAEAMLRTLADRGCALYFAFTPSIRYNHETQFSKMYPSLVGAPGLRADYFEGSDHVFTLRANQQAMTRAVESWLKPMAAPGPRTPASV